jgi:hypothetical protein
VTRHILTDTVTGEIIDLSPLARKPSKRKTSKRPYELTRSPQLRHNDGVEFLAVLALLLACISIVF